jgi:predicted AAA+ superfamily ATPase
MLSVEEFCNKTDEEEGEAWSNDYITLAEKMQEYAEYYHQAKTINYYKCECGSEDFILTHNVYNIKIKVKVDENDSWTREEHGIVKHHPIGYICAECRQDAQELNDGL